MKRLSLYGRPSSMMAAFLIPLLAFVLACGPGQEPTPTPTTAAPTATATSAPRATPTATLPGPAATPTPTTVAAPTPTPGVQPKRGGTLKNVATLPGSFDMYLGYSPVPQSFLGKFYNNLFVNYSGDKVECEICSSAGWHLEDGGKTVVVNIQPGIKFSTGQELTSADVKYSLQMMMGQIDGIVSARVGWMKEYIDSIATPSKYELDLKLVRPAQVLPKLLSTSFAMIVPQGTTRDDFKSGVTPKGTGPFLLKQFIAGASATFERNPNYFKPGLPYVDGIEWTVAADAATQYAAFFTHKFSYIATHEEPAEQYLAVLFKMRDEGRINAIEVLGSSGYYGVWMVGSKAPFNDIRIRQAVNLAVDREEVGRGNWGQRYIPQIMGFYVGEDYGTPADQIWNVVPGWGTGAKKQQEIEQAKQLVKDAGYPNGMDIPEFASTASNIGFAAGPFIVQSQLKAINIRVTMDIAKDSVDFAARLANLDYLFQTYLFARITGDPDEVIGQYQITGGSRNPTGYSNPQVDKLFILLSSESDPVKRKQIFFQVSDIILKDVWYAPAANHRGGVYYWPEIGGLDQVGLSPSFASGVNRADRIWFK